MMWSVKPFHLVLLLLLVAGVVYVLQHEGLESAGLVLLLSVGFTGLMMLLLFFISRADLKAHLDASNSTCANEGKKSKFDRAQVEKFRAEPLKNTCERISDSSEPASSKLALFHYLRETVHSDSVAAIEVVDFGVVQSALALLRSGGLDTKTALALLELVNELLSNRNSKIKLIRDISVLHEVVDACLHWLVMLSCGLFKSLVFIPASTMTLTGVLLCDSVDVNSILSIDPVAFAAGESLSARCESLICLTNKSVVFMGLLCNDECPDAQTRLNDRGGVHILLGLLKGAAMMCSTSCESGGIGLKVGITSSPLGRDALKKHSMVLCKWLCWSLFNLTLEHPPAKAVAYHAQAMTAVVDILKLHSNNAQVHRQGLAVLFNLIAPDMYGKYSLAHARQTLMATGVVEVLEHAKIMFKSDKDIVNTCRAISNSLMVDFS